MRLRDVHTYGCEKIYTRDMKRTLFWKGLWRSCPLAVFGGLAWNCGATSLNQESCETVKDHIGCVKCIWRSFFVLSAGRNVCRSCRFQKCLQVGMEPDGEWICITRSRKCLLVPYIANLPRPVHFWLFRRTLVNAALTGGLLRTLACRRVVLCTGIVVGSRLHSALTLLAVGRNAAD